ncbi:hypothetical protein [Sphingomonas sp. 28-62-11]|uniref:hypothetical protein n=1 Tax=Sphingomonas sp. 28-62-11 TaxID=1970432 RepID=UPI000BD25EDF|nr:MAG: hypothetical protein B7Y49_04385 [Sphingomonas sp. 28-62-11]
MSTPSFINNGRGFDQAVAQALDLFDVPPPGESFAARMASVAGPGAAASLGAPALPAWRAALRRHDGRINARGGSRGPWVRRSAVGLIAFGLASATAAAAGMFEAVHFEIPVIARLLSPQAPVAAERKAARREPRRAAPKDSVGEAKPTTDIVATPALPLTRAERLERFRALPLPVRAVVTERMVTRTQRRLAARGVFVPRNVVHAQVAARTGQTDLPQGTPADRRAQWRAALLAAPPGSLPPRLEQRRAQLLAQAPNAQQNPGAALPGASSGNAPEGSAASLTLQDVQALRAWREMRREQRRRWQARRAEQALAGMSAQAALPSINDNSSTPEP